MHNEKIYTPNKVVNLMLDEVGFTTIENIKDKHIIDNSCGDGNFIVEIVKRIISVIPNVDKTYFETYVHGIDIDKSAIEKCIQRLDKLCSDAIGIININWDINVSNALTDDSFMYQMDYVVGNPPYCCVHHMDKETYNLLKTELFFCSDSMTDLYIAFFERGLTMMSENGKLCYITPNSWLCSKAAKLFRKYLVETKKLEKVIDFKTDKVFTNATTFTNIVIIDNNKINKSNNVYYYNGSLNDYMFSKTKMFNSIEQAYINEQFYFNESNDIIKSIIEYKTRNKEHQFVVKNGLATLNDKLFIIEYEDLNEQSEYYVNIYNVSIIDCIKASNGKGKYIIYPYDEDGKPLKYEDIRILTRNILEERAKKLEIDTTKDGWYLYGRYQAIKDVSRFKHSINNIIRDYNDIKLCEAPKNVAVYSGFYIIKNGIKQTDDINKKVGKLIKDAVETKQFNDYIKVIGKSKNGGYYSYTTKDLEKYLNYFYQI